MVILIVGIVVMVVSFIAAMFNLVKGVSDEVNGSYNLRDADARSVAMFKRHAVFGSGVVVGMAIIGVGIVLLVV